MFAISCALQRALLQLIKTGQTQSAPTAQPTAATRLPFPRVTVDASTGTSQPTAATQQPTQQPTAPTAQPTAAPQQQPTQQPTAAIVQPTAAPQQQPTQQPSAAPTAQPTQAPTPVVTVDSRLPMARVAAGVLPGIAVSRAVQQKPASDLQRALPMPVREQS
jgi:hypothetical protein